ncbi:MAG: DUF4296 domain-containing protein [Balneola sp.]
MKRSFLLIITVLISLSCTQETNITKPDQLLDEDVYLDLFYELELLSIYQERGASSSVIDSLNEEIFKKYDISDTLFRSSHEFYQSQLTKQQIRTDTVLARLEREMSRFNRQDSLRALKAQAKE